MTLKNKTLNDQYSINVDPGQTIAISSPIAALGDGTSVAAKDYTYTGVDNIKWSAYEAQELTSKEKLNDLIGVLTGPISTHEDMVMANMHAFMSKHEYDTINSKNRELLLKRIPKEEHTLYMLIITELMKHSQISVCKTCGHLDVKRYG